MEPTPPPTPDGYEITSVADLSRGAVPLEELERRHQAILASVPRDGRAYTLVRFAGGPAWVPIGDVVVEGGVLRVELHTLPVASTLYVSATVYAADPGDGGATP